MPLSDDQIKMLDAPLNPALVKIKPTQGSPKFLEGHEAMNAANRIFGYDGWGYTVDKQSVIDAPGGALYTALVTVTVAGCQPKQDVGTEIAASRRDGEPPTVQAHETAIKGAITDGIKRALRSFGDQFGASLYDKDANLGAEYAAWQAEQNGGEGTAATGSSQGGARQATSAARPPQRSAAAPAAQRQPTPLRPAAQTQPAAATQQEQAGVVETLADAGVSDEQLIAEIRPVLARDMEAAEKLPKQLEEMTHEELVKTRGWLQRRARVAATATG